MITTLPTFFNLVFEENALIYALISLTEYIRKNLDEGKAGYGVFVVLQKAFDNADHDIALWKLEHYGISGAARFKSYLSNRKQHFPINDFNSNLATVKFVVRQGSISAPYLFLIYISNFN